MVSLWNINRTNVVREDVDPSQKIRLGTVFQLEAELTILSAFINPKPCDKLTVTRENIYSLY